MIDVKNLHKSFGSLKVLQGIDLHVNKGDVVSIIGPSGSGKSTLLRSINLLETATAGEIWVEGKLITQPDMSLHPGETRWTSSRRTTKIPTPCAAGSAWFSSISISSRTRLCWRT